LIGNKKKIKKLLSGNPHILFYFIIYSLKWAGIKIMNPSKYILKFQSKIKEKIKL